MTRNPKTNNPIHRSISCDDSRDLEMGDYVPTQSPLSSVSKGVSRKKLRNSESARSFGSFSSLKNICTDVGGSPTTPSTVIMSNRGKTLVLSHSVNSFGMCSSTKSLALSASDVSGYGNRVDQKRMYMKQVTGKHKDTELHIAAQKGDIEAVAGMLAEIDAQMMRTSIGADLDMDNVADVGSSLINEVNELGETPLFRAAEKGYLEVVKALLPYATSEGIMCKNQVGYTALHIAASHGHEDIVQVMLDHDPKLSNTLGQSNTTPLISAAVKGHLGVVNLLLSQNPKLLDIPKSNGKNALHFASRQGHEDIVRALLKQEQKLARRTDKKGQTALHMAVKGHSAQIVRLLLRADPDIIMLSDKFGSTALHIAIRKKRVEIVSELLLYPETNVNALTREGQTPMDIAEGLPYSIEIADIKDCLMRNGGVKAKDLNQPRDELRQQVTEIQKDVHSQLEQTRRTNKNVSGIAKELKRLHREGINNATNSVTVVAVLFATVAFAAIFQVPGGSDKSGIAVLAETPAFKTFFIFNAIALFTSLAVVVVQITLVRGETKSEMKVVEVINKLMWLASVCTTVSFISSSYIVVGQQNKWSAILITVIGGGMIAVVLGAMTYSVVKSKRTRKVRKKHISKHGRPPPGHDDSEDSAVNVIYAI